MVLNPARTFLIDERKAEASALSSERAFLLVRPSQDRYCVKFILKERLFMKKLFLALLAVFSIALVVAGCGGDSKPAANSGDKKVVLKVGATPVPHAEILNLIKPQLAKEGVDLQIIEFSDYVKPNLSLADKELDANFFQHTPYLEKFASERNLPLVAYTKVHIEPMGVYSKKLKDLNNVPSGAKVAIPNDPTNGGRALALLQSAKLLKLRDGVGISGTPGDIVDNPKNLQIVEIEAALLPRSMDDVDLSVINSNFAMEAQLNPVKDSLFTEPKDSPYANILAIRKGDDKRPELQKLDKALTSPEVKKFIEEKYKGAVVPAF
jgi:D-methionine transport system substrate-binding protein